MNRHGRGQEREGGSAGLQQETSPGSGSNFYIVPLGLVHLFRRAACANNLQRERMDGTILASVFLYILHVDVCGPPKCPLSGCLWSCTRFVHYIQSLFDIYQQQKLNGR